MKKNLLIVILFILIGLNIGAQVLCNNIGFEDTTFTNWTGGTGNLTNYPGPTTWVSGIVSTTVNASERDANARQTLLTNPYAYDTIVGLTNGVPNIPYLAPGGGGVSVRLGNSNFTGVASTAQTERLVYSINVTPMNTSFNYQYAAVLEYTSTNHTLTQQPRFTVNLYDGLGVLVSGPCGVYSVVGSSAATDPAFFPYSYNSGGIFGTTHTGFYTKWTQVAVDLTPYVGQTITIEFVTQDCTLGGHAGYAYIDASCSQLQTEISFCPNDTVALITAPKGFASYQWYDNMLVAIPGATSDSLYVNNPILGNQYTVIVTSHSGCTTTFQSTVTYSNLVLYHTIHNASCTTLNDGWAYVNQSGGSGTFNYTWIDIATGANVTQSAHPDSLLNAPTGIYYVTVQTSSGCIAYDTVIIGFMQNCYAWPGDADANHITDNMDLLPIGLYYSQTGIPRSVMNNNWQADVAYDWGTSQSNGNDIKNADCNGDGLIDNNDTLAINLNFNLTHTVSTPIYSIAKSTSPDLYFITSSNVYNPGDIVDVEVWAGNATTPISSLYGVAFNIHYDASLVQPNTERIDYRVSWLGTPGTDAIKIAKIDALATTAYGAETRINHTGVNGFGKIADFIFQAKTTIISPSYLHLSFSDYKSNDSAGVAQVFNTINDSVLINAGTTIGISESSRNNGITIYPNPFTSQTTISFSETQKNTTIKITDILGKEIKTISFAGKKCVIEKGEMKGGVYFVRIEDENKNAVNRKVVIE